MPSLLDDDFSKGIVRSVEGQRIPKGGVYDCVNGLLDDDLGIYRRGGAAYLSTNDGSGDLFGVWTGELAVGEQTVAWGAAELEVLDGASALQSFGASSGAPVAPDMRPVSVAGYLMVPRAGLVSIYAGSENAVNSYSTGTATVTAASRTVTGAGTSWLANVDPGDILLSGGFYAVVKSVESDTSLTLVDPWAGSTAAGAVYSTSPFRPNVLNVGGDGADAIGVAGRRLLIASGNKVFQTAPFDSSSSAMSLNTAEDYVLLPESARVLGIEGLGDTALVFTTIGVFRISNLSFDITDAYGNPQQQVTQISKDLILWGEGGIAAYQGGLVVPAIDDVYLLGADGTVEAVSRSIRPLYRGHVKAGRYAWYGAVYRNHYLLPVLANDGSPVDVLVCRLDGDRPGWTRWDDYAAGRAFALRVGGDDRSPKLYGASEARLTDLTGCFAPASGNKNEADGSTHVLSIVTRDYSAKAMVKSLWREVRARFELTDAASDNPTLTAEYAVGPVAGESWTSAGSWAEGTGEAPTRLAVNKSAQAIRFRLRSSGACASLAVRSLEVFFRGSRKR